MYKNLLLIFALLMAGAVVAKAKQDLISKITLAPGFKIAVFAENVPTVRQLAFSPDGVVFVGTAGKAGKVYGLTVSEDYTKILQHYTIAVGLNRPNGVAFKDGSLYVAEVNRITRYKNIVNNLDNSVKPIVIYDQLPNKRHHGMKYLRLGPDGKLYTGIGVPCNICNPDQIFGTLVRLNRDGSDFEIIAHGIRNSLGFDWQPGSNSLFFTDNGRDYLGDDLPPEELNQLLNIGSHFGFPYCHAGDLRDRKYGHQKDCKEFVAPVWKFKAHMAPLGMRFYQGTMFPKFYRGQLLVALHGSWNRSQPHGYKIVLVRFKQGQPVAQENFAEGWLQTSSVIGRPVDLLELPDGSILVSDNHQGVIYRISYSKP